MQSILLLTGTVYTLCTYINTIPLAVLSALPLVGSLPPLMDKKKKFPLKVYSCQSPLLIQDTHAHILPTIPSCIPLSVGTSCTAWPQNSQATPLPFSPPHNIGLFTAPLPSQLCVCLHNAALQLPFTFPQQKLSRHHKRKHRLATTALGKSISGKEKQKLDLSSFKFI